MGEIVSLRARAYRPAHVARVTILAMAEELFRRRGHDRVAFKDVAAACGMSPANLYRFFAGKEALVEAIARDWIDEMKRIADGIAGRRDQAVGRRLQDLAAQLSTFVCATHLDRRGVHDLVAKMMRERPELIRQHVGNIEAAIARILRDGQESGEVSVEPVQEAAELVFAAIAKYTHPLLIAEWPEMAADKKAARTMRLLMPGLKAGLNLGERRAS